MTYPPDPHGQQPGYGTPPPGYGPQQPGYPSHGYAVPPMTHQPQPGGPPTPQDLSDASMAHYLGIISWIGPLIYYLVAGQRSPYVKQHATRALNFHLSFIIYYLVAGFGSVIVGLIIGVIVGGFGFMAVFLYLPVMLGMLIWSITVSCVAGGKAKRGEEYQYKPSITFIKS